MKTMHGYVDQYGRPDPTGPGAHRDFLGWWQAKCLCLNFRAARRSRQAAQRQLEQHLAAVRAAHGNAPNQKACGPAGATQATRQAKSQPLKGPAR